MRFCFLLLSFFFISTSIFSQKSLKINGNKTNYLSIGKANVFANKYEVSNGDYREFLIWLKKIKENRNTLFIYPTRSFGELHLDTQKNTSNIIS